MKRVFGLILIFIAVFTVASCGDEKKSAAPKEKVSKEITAEDGGTISTNDESVAVDIPADALDSDTTITVSVYESSHYPTSKGETVVSTVVEFEPSGTIFKKPVIIRMTTNKAIKNKVVAAAVYNEAKGAWSYNEHGAYAVLAGKDAAGDPIMQSAAGDPIMLNAAGDPIMMSAAGDPIMMAAAGDPIMLASAGDPIMSNAAGDPIMNAAAGDPIMMTTGHFTSYTFIELGEEEEVPVVVPDNDSDDSDDADDVDDVEPDEDTEPTEDVPECGNGVVEKGEECDNGADNGTMFCDYGEESCELCSLSCESIQGNTSYCGDGLIDTLNGETCDDGAILNGTYAHCNATCSGPASYCGDGHVDEEEGETCDDGADNDTYGHCNATCDGKAPYCGDGTKQSNEACDKADPEYGEGEGIGSNCSDDCQTATISCGILPANAEWVNGDTYESTLDGDGSSPSAHYAETGDCAYKCKATYSWIDSNCTCTDAEHVENGVCTSNTQAAASCGTLPANAEWVSGDTYIPTWNGSAYSSATANYAETGDCAYKCKATYSWIDSNCTCTDAEHVENGVCTSNTQAAASCGTLPANAEWVSGDTYIPTWNGSAYSSATANYAETGDCAYKCKSTYSWIDSNCTCTDAEHVENGVCTSNTQAAASCGTLPANAEWVSGDTYIPTWNGSAYSSATANYAETGDCSFKCKENYNWNENNGTCVAATQQANCSNPPANAERNTATSITQTWSGEEWLPSATSVYSDEASTEECFFKCKENYEWNAGDEICVAQTRYEDCIDLPPNAQWNTTESITQTWSGEAWLPALSGVYNEEASTEECRFKCKENYEWSNASASCVAQTRRENCSEPPANAEWNTVSAITQTWSGSAWLPVTDSVYNETASTEECRFKCKENYEWDGENEVCTAKTRRVDCSEPPANAEWNTVSAITQTWSGEAWLPSATSVYSTDDSTEECRFKCKENYDWSNGSCVAQTRRVDCTDLPDNAEWNTVSAITQTWSGEAWLPALSGVYNETASEEECRFKCSEGYEWNANTSTCDPEPRCGDGILNGDEVCDDGDEHNGQYGFCYEGCTGCDDEYHVENGHCVSNSGEYTECEGELPDYAEWVNDTYYRYWVNEGDLGDATGYWYVAEPTYSEEEYTDCSFRCLDGFEWNENLQKCECPQDRELNDTDPDDPYCALTGENVRDCSAKPENSVWTDNGQHGQYIFSMTFQVTTQYAGGDSCDCCFDCAEGYHYLDDRGECESDTRAPEECPDSPTNTEWVGNGYYTPVWNGEIWSTPQPVYDESGESDCSYRCKENYQISYESGRCIAATRDGIECDGLPDNAEWNGSGIISQTWTGQEWYPSSTAFYSTEIPPMEDCSFMCNKVSYWNEQTNECEGL